jgi:RNA polymerase sigma-70 factor (ECF subfamily)
MGWGEQLRRFLKPRVGNASDIPDIIQEVYLRLLRVPNQHTIRAPEAYLYAVTRHVLQQYTLKQAVHRSAQPLEDVLAETRAAEESDPLLEATAQECLEELDRALSQMPPKVQATFLFVRRDGLSMEEISQKLGISVPMAKKYLVKALASFRKRLASQGDAS